MARLLKRVPLMLGLVIAWSLMAHSQLTLSGRVVDNAHLLTAAEIAELDQLLAQHEKATSNQVVVVTVASLEGQNIEEFGYQLGRQWGIGTKDKNNGAMLIVAPNERQVRIEVGYGLEETLTDAKSKLIIERNILPYFKRGEMGQGVVQGAKAIIDALGGDVILDEKISEEEEDPSFLHILMFFGLFFVVAIILRALRNRPGRGPRPPTHRGGFFGGGSSGSSRGGGFSGGGGSFGGGGASGRW